MHMESGKTPQLQTQPATVAVHPAPIDSSTPESDAESKTTGQTGVHRPHEHAKAVTPHFGHRPVGAIVLIVMAMVILSGLSILVYLNS